MDTVIKVKCIDQTLTLINSPVIASGGLNENKLECDFCEKWDGFSKTAVFYQDKKNVYYSVLDENDTCIIPKEATANKGTMFFGIFGSKDGVTRTSEIIRYKIDEGAITEDLKPSDPTPDIYEQLLAKLQEIREAEATFETNITNQQNTFEEKITKQENDYESDLNTQWSTYKTDLTKQQSDYETNLNGQMTTFKSETEAEIAEKLSKVYRLCGSVANYEALPKNAEVGDVYNLLDTGVNYVWTGTEWDSLAGIIDLSNYYKKAEVDTKLNTESTNRTNADNTLQNNINNIINGTQVVGHATTTDKAQGAYTFDIGTSCTSSTANILCEYYGKVQYIGSDNLRSTIRDWFYPIGSIYMSVNNVNPGSIFGGTWEQIKDKFLLASGDTYSLGSTGGEATHTLTIDEIPSHTHTVDDGWTWNVAPGFSGGTHQIEQKTSTQSGDANSSGDTWRGGSQAHNNMPPYLTVNVWKRTA